MKTRAFTLIELLVVISIIALLSSVVLASINTAREKGRMAAIRQFSSQVDHVASDSAVALLDFDECSGGPALDRSGNGNTGTLGGMSPSPQSTDSPSGIGCSLSFNGTTAYVRTPMLNLPDSFTFAIWVKPTTPYIGGSIIKGEGSSTPRLLFGSGVTLDLISTSLAGISGVKIDSWNFITLVYDGATDIYRLYINGNLRATSAVTTINGTDTYVLGAANTGGYQPFQGFLDGFHVFAKGLTAGEVGKLYAEGLSKNLSTTRE